MPPVNTATSANTEAMMGATISRGPRLAGGLTAAISPTMAGPMSVKSALAATDRPSRRWIPGLLALTVLVGSVQILISARCRNVKEANTCLSVLMFAMMALAMGLAFRPDFARQWWFLLPVAGQQRLLQLALIGSPIAPLQAILLAAVTVLLTAPVLLGAASGLVRDEGRTWN